jgi:hypothetical protein
MVEADTTGGAGGIPLNWVVALSPRFAERRFYRFAADGENIDLNLSRLSPPLI